MLAFPGIGGAASPATLRTDVACSPLTTYQGPSFQVGSPQTCRVRVRNDGSTTATGVTASHVSPFAFTSISGFQTLSGVKVADLTCSAGSCAAVDLPPGGGIIVVIKYTKTAVPDSPGPTTGCGDSTNTATACGIERSTLP